MTLIRALPFDARDNYDVSNAAFPHVLLVVDQFSETFGGGERIALKLAALLPKYGYRVSILTFFVHPQCAELKSAPCPIYVLPLQRTYDLSALRAALALKRFLKQERIQIVQTFFESSDLWAGLVTKVMSDAKLIWSRRDMGILRGRKHHIAYKLMSGTPDAVFAVSEQVRQHGITVDGIPSNRVLTIYNGLDVADWNTMGLDKDTGKFVVATLGNIRKVKGHDVVLRAAASVVREIPRASFVIAGEVLEPDYFKELQELVRELNLTDHFSFVSGVTDIREFLSTVDIFVLPSRSEGFSNASIEAMAASLPVVATDVGGNAEAVKNGVSGFIVPSENVSALSAAILRLLSDPSKAKEMGDAGRRIVVEKFTIDAMMHQITDVYSSLLEGRTLPNPALR
jgi:glycosyltransferase involved in cell wall biosynthesis